MGFIKRHSALSRLPHSSTTGVLQSQTTRITLPYINNVSEATARLLAPYGVKVAHRPDRTLRSCIMRPKDPLPTAEKSGVIYRINCYDCPSNYVGETSKRVKTRVQEHKLAVRRGEQYSQIFTHMVEFGHRFNFDEVRVIANDTSKSGRLLKEAWLSSKESINRHVDLRPAHLAMKAWETRTRLMERNRFNNRGLEGSSKRTDSEEKENPHAVIRPSSNPHVYPSQVRKSNIVNSLSPEALNASPYHAQQLELRTICTPIGKEYACHLSTRTAPLPSNDAFVATCPIVEDMGDDKAASLNLLPRHRTDRSCRSKVAPLEGMQRTNTHGRSTVGAVTRSQRVAQQVRKDGGEPAGLGVASDHVKDEDGRHRLDHISTRTFRKIPVTMGAMGESSREDESPCSSPKAGYGGKEDINTHDVCQKERGKHPGICKKGSQINDVKSRLAWESIRRPPDLGVHRESGEVDGDLSVSGGCKNKLLSAVSEARINRLGPITRSMSQLQARLYL